MFKRVSASILVAGLALWAHYAILGTVLDNWNLQLGLIDFPTGGFMVFTAIWSVFGTLCALALASALVGILGRDHHWERLRSELLNTRDVYWWLGGAIVAAGMAILLRIYLLHQMPLTDDEGAYQFAAELLASGRLWVPSHPMKGFLDRMFFINDGRYFPAYFWGWPALMAPGVWLGISGFMAAIYSGFTVPALYLVSRRFWGRGWARLTVVLYLASPFLALQAATQMSQTAEIFALAWALHFYLRSRDAGTSARIDFALAICLGTAFWIRPISALGFGGALCILWFIDALRSSRGTLRRILAFLVPGLLLAGLLLGLQNYLYGSPWATGYERMREYLIQNHFQFSTISRERLQNPVPLGFDLASPSVLIARWGSGLYRLSFDFLGWPIGLAVAAFAVGSRRLRSLRWMTVGGAVVMLLQRDGGIDTYGPVHYAEFCLPLLLFLTASTRKWIHLPALHPDGKPAGQGPQMSLRAAGPALVLAAIISGWIGYVPIRWFNVSNVVANIEQPVIAARQSKIRDAVVFAPYPYAPPCRIEPSRHFVFTPPVNDPDLTNDLLWFYNQGLARDRQFMNYFPDRAGYLLIWTRDCHAVIAPLEAVEEIEAHSGRKGGSS